MKASIVNEIQWINGKCECYYALEKDDQRTNPQTNQLMKYFNCIKYHYLDINFVRNHQIDVVKCKNFVNAGPKAVIAVTVCFDRGTKNKFFGVVCNYVVEVFGVFVNEYSQLNWFSGNKYVVFSDYKWPIQYTNIEASTLLSHVVAIAVTDRETILHYNDHVPRKYNHSHIAPQSFSILIVTW